MTMDKVINILVTLGLIEMMVAIGMSVTFSQVAAAARNRVVVAKAALANFILVPAIAIILLLLFHADPMVAAGFLIVAACPGAPYGPLFTGIARGNIPLSVGMMVILAGSSAIVSPVLLRIALPRFSDSGALTIDMSKLVGTLLVTQLVPLLIGLVVRQWRPRLADRLKSPFDLATKVLNVAALVLILAVQYRMLAQIRLVGFLGMLALLAASLLIGWFAGGRGVENRKTISQTTALRNVGLGMVIASGNFAGTPALSAVVAYAVVSIGGALLLAVFWGRQKPTAIQLERGVAA